MAREPTKAGKSETLTIRLDPKTRFVLDYLSRLKGQTITTVVERAIVTAASQDPIYIDEVGQVSWQYFWDVSEGARSINIARTADFFPTYEEEKRVAFCSEHWPFFFSTSDKKAFRYPFLNILWPRIDEFVDIHERTKEGGDYWAAGKAMQKALADAGIAAPDWPVKSRYTPPKGKTGAANPEDEIPF